MKKNTEKKYKKDKPPYLSGKRLEKLFEIISTRNLKKVEPESLKSRGIKGTDANIAISALRFLGIVDENGKTTELVKKLKLKGKDKEEAIKTIVKSAYSELFETVSEPYELPKQELYNELLSVYDLSARITKSAVPAFLWLCSRAGLRKEQPREIKKERVTKKKIKTDVSVRPKEPSFELADEYLTIPIKGGVQLKLPSAFSAQIMVTEEFKKIMKDLIKFSEFSESLHKRSQKEQVEKNNTEETENRR